MAAFSLRVFVVLLFALALVSSQNKRMTRETEEKIKKLDMQTKKKILAMHAAGMPRDAIANSISYQTGGNKDAAHRIVEGVKSEAEFQKKFGNSKTAQKPKAAKKR